MDMTSDILSGATENMDIVDVDDVQQTNPQDGMDEVNMGNAENVAEGVEEVVDISETVDENVNQEWVGEQVPSEVEELQDVAEEIPSEEIMDEANMDNAQTGMDMTNEGINMANNNVDVPEVDVPTDEIVDTVDNYGPEDIPAETVDIAENADQHAQTGVNTGGDLTNDAMNQIPEEAPTVGDVIEGAQEVNPEEVLEEAQDFEIEDIPVEDITSVSNDVLNTVADTVQNQVDELVDASDDECEHHDDCTNGYCYDQGERDNYMHNGVGKCDTDFTQCCEVEGFGDGYNYPNDACPIESNCVQKAALSTATIAGIAVGGVAVAALVFGFVLYKTICKKNKLYKNICKKNKGEDEESPKGQTHNQI